MGENRQQRRAAARERERGAQRQPVPVTIPPPPIAPTGAKPPWRMRLRDLFKRYKLPAWLAWLVLAIKIIPDINSRFDYWVDAAKASGGSMSILATALASPFFNAGLAGFGVLWMLFVGEPARGVRRHPAWLAAGWLTLALVIGAMGAVAVNGYVNIRVQEEIAQRMTSERHIYPTDRIPLIRALKPIASEFTRSISVSAVDTPEANGYAREIMSALSAAGIRVDSESSLAMVPHVMRALDPTVRGVFFQVLDPSHPPQEVADLTKALSLGRVVVHYARNPQVLPAGYILTIAPP